MTGPDYRGKALFDQNRLLDVVDIEATVLAETVDVVRNELRIPHATGLTVGETARHVGSVHRMTLEWIRTGDTPETWQREPGPLQSLRDYVASGARALVDELQRHDPGEPCSTWWAADSTYGFWRRRMAHETTVHRIDVQAAASGHVDDVAEDFAVDGVDEVLTLWFGHRLMVQGVVGARDGTVAVRTRDRAWLTRVTTGGLAAWRLPPQDVPEIRLAAGPRGEKKVDAVVSGPPSLLYRWLWGRLPPAAASWEGDDNAVHQLWALLRVATR
ncbi:MAG: maleylpyruvate isomerase N-terminal domain-containing protein [Kibdelosporangium sp.]